MSVQSRAEAMADNECDACGGQLGDLPTHGARGTYCTRTCMRWVDDVDDACETCGVSGCVDC
jgi:hypothetical protein